MYLANPLPIALALQHGQRSCTMTGSRADGWMRTRVPVTPAIRSGSNPNPSIRWAYQSIPSTLTENVAPPIG